MSSRSARKRRHREDFVQYMQSRKQWKNIASQWKMFGFPNEVVFMKALVAHQQKQEKENRRAQIQEAIETARANGEYEQVEHLTSELSMWDEVLDDAEGHIHGENCNHDHHHHEDAAAGDAAEELAQQKLRQGIEDSYATDRANLDLLPESDHE